MADNESKISVTIRLKPSFAEAIRNAAFWVGQGTSLNSILEDGGAEVLKRLEKQFNSGKPFPQRTKELAERPLRTNKGKAKGKA